MLRLKLETLMKMSRQTMLRLKLETLMMAEINDAKIEVGDADEVVNADGDY